MGYQIQSLYTKEWSRISSSHEANNGSEAPLVRCGHTQPNMEIVIGEKVYLFTRLYAYHSSKIVIQLNLSPTTMPLLES